MTGFGDASGRGSSDDGSADIEFFVEIRSVNAKYFKALMRLPEEVQPLEPEFETLLRRKLDRGTVTLRIAMSDASEDAAMSVNHRAFDRYVEELSKSEAVRTGRVSLDAAGLLQLPGVLQAPRGEDERLARARAVVMPLVEAACGALVKMREHEGVSLSEDLSAQLDVMEQSLSRITEVAPGVVRAYEERLKSRIALLLDDQRSIDQVDLIREIAVYAEKTDIAEEIARLGAHIKHFRERLAKDGGAPVGRTLDFLTQEMLREANTMASKTPDAEVASMVVEIKGAIDRVKEQVQNVA